MTKITRPSLRPLFSINEDRNANVEADASTKTESGDRDRPKIEIPEDAFLMVTQVNWEDEVIWNGDDIKHKVRPNYRPRVGCWLQIVFIEPRNLVSAIRNVIG